MSTYKEKYEEWLNNTFFYEEVKNDLLNIANDEAEKEDRFYKDLEFGTAGLRGVVGIGTNRMNKFTVVLTSIVMFVFFARIKMATNNVVNAFARSTFGIYILHVSLSQYIFKQLLPNDSYFFSNLFIFHAFISVVTVFFISAIVDLFINPFVAKFTLLEERLIKRLKLSFPCK